MFGVPLLAPNRPEPVENQIYEIITETGSIKILT